MINQNQLAKLLGVTRQAIHDQMEGRVLRYRRWGIEIPAVRRSQRWYFKDEDVWSLLKELKIKKK
jgi:biotin operon repressor